MQENTKFIYGGLSGLELALQEFDLAEGIVLRQTYAHLMSPTMMAFARPEKQGHYHPPPWKPAKGGFSFDIEIELQIPIDVRLAQSFDAQETLWLIAALLRLKFPFLSVPVIADYSFKSIPDLATEPTLQPFEIAPRRVRPSDPSRRILEAETLSWVKEKLIPTMGLINSNPKFHTAFKAFDSSTIYGRASASLLALWGGMEQLFAPSSGELRFRLASLIASYLEPLGSNRLDLYKRILKLYDKRSLAAHTAEEVDTIPLAETYTIMRNALVRIIDENRVPTQIDLEALLFGHEHVNN